tara:strand:- start:63 stop:608 length:546 start_codon:yes stop_codon:yes gene_type:complete
MSCSTDLQELYGILENTNIKNTRKRPNILYNNSNEYTYCDKNNKVKKVNSLRKCRSMTFGLYKEMYVKNPKIKSLMNNIRHPVLYEKLKSIMYKYDPTFEFDCITVNKNVVTKPHTDKNNKSKSYILFLGDYEGGELLNEKGEIFDQPNVFYNFEGRVKHWNNKIKSGTKYSIIWFNRFHL